MEFKNVTEFLRLVQSKPRLNDDLRYSVTGTERFTHTASLDEAIDLARTGWKGGTDEIAKLRAEINGQIRGWIPATDLVYSMRGKSFDMGRYVAGRPDCARKRVDNSREREARIPKRIHMVVNISATAKISRSAMLRRGAAAVVLSDLLQRRGKHVSIDVVRVVSNRLNEPSAPKHEIRVRIKEAGAPANIDKLAFMLGHPSALRRLMWSACEHEPDNVRKTFGFGKDCGSYGIPAESDDQGDIYIGRMLSPVDWSPGFALNWLRAGLEKQGMTLKEV